MKELLKWLIQSGRLDAFGGDEAQLPGLLQGIDLIRKGAFAAGIRQLRTLRHWGLAEVELARDTIPFWNCLNAAAEDYHGSFMKPFADGNLAFLWGTLLGPYAGLVFSFYDEAPKFGSRVVGIRYDGREMMLEHLRPGWPVALLWEPKNPKDPMAVKVFDALGRGLGYMRSIIARSMVSRFQKGQTLEARITQVLGPEFDINERLNVEVSVHGKKEDSFRFKLDHVKSGSSSYEQTYPTSGDGDEKTK